MRRLSGRSDLVLVEEPATSLPSAQIDPEMISQYQQELERAVQVALVEDGEFF